VSDLPVRFEFLTIYYTPGTIAPTGNIAQNARKVD